MPARLQLASRGIAPALAQLLVHIGCSIFDSKHDEPLRHLPPRLGVVGAQKITNRCGSILLSGRLGGDNLVELR